MRTSGYDYTHYIDKQIRPVADAVLNNLGSSLAQLLGEPGSETQLELF